MSIHMSLMARLDGALPTDEMLRRVMEHIARLRSPFTSGQDPSTSGQDWFTSEDGGCADELGMCVALSAIECRDAFFNRRCCTSCKRILTT